MESNSLDTAMWETDIGWFRAVIIGTRKGAAVRRTCRARQMSQNTTPMHKMDPVLVSEIYACASSRPGTAVGKGSRQIGIGGHTRAVHQHDLLQAVLAKGVRGLLNAVG